MLNNFYCLQARLVHFLSLTCMNYLPCPDIASILFGFAAARSFVQMDEWPVFSHIINHYSCKNLLLLFCISTSCGYSSLSEGYYVVIKFFDSMNTCFWHKAFF